MYLSSLSLALRLHREKKHLIASMLTSSIPMDSLPSVSANAWACQWLFPPRGHRHQLFTTSFRLIRPMLRWTLTHAAGAIAVSADLRNKVIALGIPKLRFR